MDLPPPPQVPSGRPALPAFLPLERALRDALEAESTRAEEERARAGEEAERIRREGRQRLERVLLDAQEEALREAERRARERVNAVRSRGQRWVDEAEQAARSALDEALDLCCGE